MVTDVFVGDYFILLDKNDEEIARGLATHSQKEGWRSNRTQFIYSMTIKITESMFGKELVKTRLVLPMAVVTKEISPVKLTQIGSNLTVNQEVGLTVE